MAWFFSSQAGLLRLKQENHKMECLNIKYDILKTQRFCQVGTHRSVKFVKVLLHSVDVFMNSQAPLPPECLIDSLLLLVPLLMWLQVEHLHDAVIREVAFITKELFDQDLEAFETCGSLEDIDGCTQDIDCDVEHGAAGEEAVRVVDEMALGGSTESQNICRMAEKSSINTTTEANGRR